MWKLKHPPEYRHETTKSTVVELEPPLPFEFVVHGQAVSHQAKGSSRPEWISLVREAALAHLPEAHFFLTQKLHVTIYLFPQAPLTGDIDNRVKPILDAMSRCVYEDDHQVSRLVVQ